ncbi:hypothetical protein Ancab_025012 [Ancistrocladus abbreviatus]
MRGRHGKPSERNPKEKAGGIWSSSRSYEDAVHAHRGSVEDRTRLMKQSLRNTKVGECSKGVLELVLSKEDNAWLNGSYIVVVHPSVDILSLHNQLPSLHNFGCELRSRGGWEVLISSEEEEGVVRLLAKVNSRADKGVF